MSDNKPFGIIYMATNIINNKIYIGKTIKELAVRRRKHEYLASKRNPATHFHKAIKLYGKDNFVWEVLIECYSEDNMNAMERHFINVLKSVDTGYNMTYGGEGSIGRICLESTKAKISMSKSGIPLSDDHKKLLSSIRKGKPKDISHILKVAESKSKDWEITFPNGDVTNIKNLSSFCRKHNINDNGMRLVAKGKRNQHKGFKCRKI